LELEVALAKLFHQSILVSHYYCRFNINIEYIFIFITYYLIEINKINFIQGCLIFLNKELLKDRLAYEILRVMLNLGTLGFTIYVIYSQQYYFSTMFGKAMLICEILISLLIGYYLFNYFYYRLNGRCSKLHRSPYGPVQVADKNTMFTPNLENDDENETKNSKTITQSV
jgi:hypothetical protein